MKLEQSFEVAAPIDRVWDALIDVEQVAPCLPGASVTGRNEDGSYAGNLTIKIGPTTAAYAGRLEMEDDRRERAHGDDAGAGDRQARAGRRQGDDHLETDRDRERAPTSTSSPTTTSPGAWPGSDAAG